MLHYASTGNSSGGLAERLAKAVDDKNLDRKWVKASMGVMSYEHEIRVLTHELEDIQVEIDQKNAEIEQKKAELEQKLAELKQKCTELEQKGTELKQKDAELEQKGTELKRKDAELEQKGAELDTANEEIETLKDLLRRLASGEQVDPDSVSLDDSELMDLLRKKSENA